MNTSEAPTTVVKGEIDSIYRRPSGGGESFSNTFGIIGFVALAKIAFVAVLIGLYYALPFIEKLLLNS